ncbi:glycosyltransferase family 4 protein [Meridianimarinicoccus sp. RP-17]|uniref:glycosyltransferase family 4 protein n=1 Tax=Meridianimarinicoccus zhengii TaxID=2056810 RepID=UPI000DACA749|nr:glycosyltransferase family 4 protein [Phycocomes zhengii]
MRIAHVCTDPGIPVFGTKGASIHVQEILRAFLRRGDDVTVISPRLHDAPPDDLRGLTCCALPLAPKDADAMARADWALDTNDRVEALLAETGPFDLIYERHALYAHGAMEAAAARGIPSVLELNAPLIEEQDRHRGLVRRDAAIDSARRGFAAAGHVAAVSQGAAAYALDHGAPPHRVAVVPNGVNPARFPRTDRATGPFTVGFLGTLKPWHDTPTLIEAFALLRAGCAPDARLLVVGDGPDRGRIEARLDALGLADAAHLTGAVPASDVAGWLGRMHVAVAPYSAAQPFYFSPLKIYEYMAAGLPVLASRVGDLPQVLDGGRLGLLVEPDDPAALAHELARLARDATLCAALGRNARAHVLEHRTWDAVADRVIAAAQPATWVA